MEEIKQKSVFMGLLTINNRTDKKYKFKSKNNFGLSWSYVDDEELLVIRQNMSSDGNKWSVVAHLKDFSIIEFIVK
jgi:hypothetical protein